MKTNPFLPLATLLFLATANAATIAVLEITLASDEEASLTISETKFLTDELRRQATRILPNDYSVLTREKIISLIPETAENLNSVIDIGIVIKSDYVTRGSIDKLEDLFTLTVELYETSSGNLLSSFVKESTNYIGLLDAIRGNAPDLFAKIAPPSAIATPETAMEPQPASIPTNIPSEPRKGKTSFWVAIGLDALGAAAVGLGVYSHAKMKGYYRDSESLLNGIPKEPDGYAERRSEFAAKYKKAQDTERLRNVFYATGGALLLGGVAVHIWF